MILEGIVTTLGADGDVNVAPMGPMVPDDAPNDFSNFVLRPYKTATTYANLKRHGEGVLHVTDDVLLLAKAAIGPARPPLVAASSVQGFRLADCCRFFEFTVERWEESDARTTLTARVVHAERVRDFFGLSRAKHAVVEAAILATRAHLFPRVDIMAEMARLRVLVEKTAGHQEREAFELLDRYLTLR